MTNAKKADEILTAAAQHMRDRAATYDKPGGERSMAQTVAIFNLYHCTSLTEAQGWHMMQILKDVRLFARPGYHADSAEDCTAYSALKAEAMASVQGSKPVEKATDPAPDTDGWIDWAGGECPVDPYVSVDVILRAGARGRKWCSGASRWHWAMVGTNEIAELDIIKYRLSKP
jgi:hypothetical protein